MDSVGQLSFASWAQWIKLPVRENDHAVRTPSGLPKELPSTLFIRNVNGIAAWRHFLIECPLNNTLLAYKKDERVTRLELATSTLARLHSTN